MYNTVCRLCSYINKTFNTILVLHVVRMAVIMVTGALGVLMTSS